MNNGTLKTLQRLVERNPTVDVCMNARGIKVGKKGSDQTEWVRMAWKDLTVQRLSRAIDRVTSSYTISAAQVAKADDVLKRRLAQWQREADKKRAEVLDIEGKYCLGSDCDSYVAKFCKAENLTKREEADLLKFLAFAKRKGYLPRDATVNDVMDFCEQWRQQ